MSNGIYDVAVIGAGASGLMLAASLDMGCSSGVVLEGTSSIGSKLLMSGGGRCNITHGGSIKEFVSAYGEAGAKLRRCLYKHNNQELVSWLEGVGVPTKEEESRVFPASMRARDVLDALVEEAASNKWQIETDAKVSEIRKAETIDLEDIKVDMSADGDDSHERVAKTGGTKGINQYWEIEFEGRGRILARNIVIASGGITYPETGSDGSMLSILKELEVEINEPRSALAPIFVKDYPYEELAGISVADVSITMIGRHGSGRTCDSGEREKLRTVRMSGNILFTHEGFSGPAILNISKFAEKGGLMKIDYGKSSEELPKRMQKALQDRARGESGDIKTKLLEALLRADEFEIEGVSERGMITSGGVMLDEVDLSSMRCKKHEGLYIIGEALDADGITGGYNLQMCWSTARSAADDLREIVVYGKE